MKSTYFDLYCQDIQFCSEVNGLLNIFSLKDATLPICDRNLTWFHIFVESKSWFFCTRKPNFIYLTIFSFPIYIYLYFKIVVWLCVMIKWCVEDERENTRKFTRFGLTAYVHGMNALEWLYMDIKQLFAMNPM